MFGSRLPPCITLGFEVAPVRLSHHAPPRTLAHLAITQVAPDHPGLMDLF